MAKKLIFYEDARRDDFAKNGIRAKPVPADFPFIVRHPLWRLLEFFLYRLFATPVVFLIGKIGFGLKIRNRKALRKLKGKGFFLYGNHTQEMMDAYTPTLVSFPKHAHIVVGPEAVSVSFLRRIVPLLGGIPLPGSAGGYRPFLAALHDRIGQGRVIAVYPEAHIWPWYTGIRDFPSAAFAYPVREGAPAVAFVTTFRERKLLKFLWPCLTVTLSDPFYPDLSLPPREAKEKLRDEVYEFMCRAASGLDNYAYYEYRKKEKEPESSERA